VGHGSKRPGWEVVKVLEFLGELMREGRAVEVDVVVFTSLGKVTVGIFEVTLKRVAAVD